jgi:hypothetical protein
MEMIQISAVCYSQRLLFSSWYVSHWFSYLNGVGEYIASHLVPWKLVNYQQNI